MAPNGYGWRVQLHLSALRLLAFCLVALVATPAAIAASAFTHVPTPEQLQKLPSYRYMQLSEAEVLQELRRRKVPFIRVGSWHGMRTPIRLTGPLHGVQIRSTVPKAQRGSSYFELLDARLALALDDFCVLLAKHDIVELVHYNMWRPNGPKPGTKKKRRKRPKAKKAKARSNEAKKKPSSRHRSRQRRIKDRRKERRKQRKQRPRRKRDGAGRQVRLLSHPDHSQHDLGSDFLFVPGGDTHVASGAHGASFWVPGEWAERLLSSKAKRRTATSKKRSHQRRVKKKKQARATKKHPRATAREKRRRSRRRTSKSVAKRRQSKPGSRQSKAKRAGGGRKLKRAARGRSKAKDGSRRASKARKSKAGRSAGKRASKKLRSRRPAKSSSKRKGRVSKTKKGSRSSKEQKKRGKAKSAKKQLAKTTDRSKTKKRAGSTRGSNSKPVKVAKKKPKPIKKKPKPIKKKLWAPPGYRHPAGLAIDVGGFRKRDGSWLGVASHFDGKIGQRTCGPGAGAPRSARGKELWAIVCEVAQAGMFTYVLTPNYDRAHVDHFHMELRPKTHWQLFH